MGKIMLNKRIFVILSFLYSRMSFADLAVTPTRIILDEKNRNAVVSLVNQSKESVVYRVSWIHYSMNTDGSYEETKEPRKDSSMAESSIRYSPRLVKLDPGETQVVRLSIKDMQALSEGEYRTHLLFRSDPTQTNEQSKNSDSGVSVNLAVAKGVAIPVLLRKGSSLNKAEIASAEIMTHENSKMVKIKIKREGLTSTYGDVEVLGLKSDGNSERIGLLKGVAIFLEIPYRTVNIPIEESALAKSKFKQILIKYKKSSSSEGESMSEFKLPLN